MRVFSPPFARQQATLSQHAYERLEEAIVDCTLQPGRYLAILDLQAMTGVGRTPTHLAVTKLAADTLVTIRPRHGLQITPIELGRERTLLELRRDLERFVVTLAIRHADPAQRGQLRRLATRLRAVAGTDPVAAFNRLDLQLNRLLLAAAGEPFLENSLRPLHTMSRRAGWLYYSLVRPDEGLRQTLDCHLAILDGVIGGHDHAALAATDRLIDLGRAMVDTLTRTGDPGLFDCNRIARHA